MIRTLILVALATFSTPLVVPQGRDAAPGAEHARLAKLAGDWTVTTTFRFGGAPPREFRGKARATAILGGRFVQFDETATEFGQPVERQKTFGFNTAARRYESTWRYTGATAAMHLTGTSKDGGRTIAGDAAFAGADGATESFTWDLIEVDADTLSSTLVAAGGEGEPKATFTATYKRQRAAK